LANTLYYSLVGAGTAEGAYRRGAALGLLEGVGAVLLPGPMGLGTGPSARTPRTALMTVGWYLAGGIAGATTCAALSSRVSYREGPTRPTGVQRPLGGSAGPSDRYARRATA